MPFLILFSIRVRGWNAWAGLGWYCLGLADNSVVPMPGSMDALTIVLSAHQKSWWPYYAMMATIGGMVGGYVTYGLGFKSGEKALEKRVSKKKAEKIYNLFERYGFWSLFVPALLPPPVPYLAISDCCWRAQIS